MTEEDGDVDAELIQDWVHTLLQTKGASIYRMKGVLSTSTNGVPDERKLVLQSVHHMMQGDWMEEWGSDESRVSRLVSGVPFLTPPTSEHLLLLELPLREL